MVDHADSEQRDSADGESASEGVETVESYEIEGGVVFYDAENPLAWVETTRTVRLREAV